MADVEADRRGKGKERGIGKRRAFFSPLPPLTLFFLCQRPRLWMRGRLIKESREPEMDGQENTGVVLR